MPLIVRVPELGEVIRHAFTGGGVAPDDQVLGGVERGEFDVVLEGGLHPIQLPLEIIVSVEWDIGTTQLLEG